MSEQIVISKQTGQYDKIIKENLDITLPVIVRDVLGLEVLLSEELPDDIQHTKERKADSLKKITDLNGLTYVLQIEFQVSDEPEMVFRMAEYSIMLLRKYRLPVKQYVIYLRDSIPAMNTQLDTPHHKFEFSLIRISETDYKIFLDSDNPEVKMLGILANFNKEEHENTVKAIVEGIQTSTKNQLDKSKHFKQLRTFVQLRDQYKPEIEKAMESISTFFKEENDFLYRKGEAKGEIKGEAKGEIKGEKKKSRVVVTNLITQLDASNEQIARLAEVSVAYVRRIRARISKC